MIFYNCKKYNQSHTLKVTIGKFIHNFDQANMSISKKNPGPVPPRWLHCPRKSDGLIINKFMVMKTPLSSDFDEQVPPACRFTPKMVFDNCKLKKVNVLTYFTSTESFYKSYRLTQDITI